MSETLFGRIGDFLQRRSPWYQLGLDHIRHNGMASILLRHYPELADSLKGIVNPFAPWRTARSVPVKSAAGDGV